MSTSGAAAARINATGQGSSTLRNAGACPFAGTRRQGLTGGKYAFFRSRLEKNPQFRRAPFDLVRIGHGIFLLSLTGHHARSLRVPSRPTGGAGTAIWISFGWLMTSI